MSGIVVPPRIARLLEAQWASGVYAMSQVFEFNGKQSERIGMKFHLKDGRQIIGATGGDPYWLDTEAKLTEFEIEHYGIG